MKLSVTAALALAGAIGVAGCQSTGGSSPSANMATVVAQVQQLTQQACSVLPVADSIAQIVKVGDPALATAELIADAICGAVAKAPAGAGRKMHPVTIDGIPVNFQ